MELETGIIKGNKTKYFNKTENKEIIKHSKYVNLGVNSNFNIGDEVVVLSNKEYNSILNGNDDAVTLKERIKELTNTIDDKDNMINNINDELEQLNKEIRNNNSENISNIAKISALTEELKTVELELTELKTILKQYDINTADGLNNLIKEFRIILNYLNDCVIAYEKQNRLKRFLKQNPTIDIAKPPTNLLDYRGNPYINNDGDYINTNVDDSNKSEQLQPK